MFLLSSPSGNYVLLRIVPKETADARGVSEKVKPKELFSKLEENVVKRDNGDVLVGNIPMVNQGPKGYCVPATWERYLRYLGFEADMYVLAMGAGTSTNGTSDAAISGFVNALIQDRGYRVSPAGLPLTVAGISRSIDAGIPLMWDMFALQILEDPITLRSRERAEVTDWESWQGRLKEDRKQLKRWVISDEDKSKTAHLCMIIGYNAKTREIAVSDSWGPAFAERWITEEEAAMMNQTGLFCLTK